MRTLRDLLRELPSTALVPVGWVLEQLGSPDDSKPSSIADLTISEIADRLDRSVSTVRAWCANGLLEGAYRLRGREWRVPSAALRGFLDRQGQSKTGRVPRRTAGDIGVDLTSWRRAHFAPQDPEAD